MKINSCHRYSSEKKNPLINRVCPLCRTFGQNIRFMDLHDDTVDVSLTIVTCMACRGVYSIDFEADKDEKKG